MLLIVWAYLDSNFRGELRRALFWNGVRNGRSRSSKVTDFGTNRKRVRDFLLLINTNCVLYCTVSEIRRTDRRTTRRRLIPALRSKLCWLHSVWNHRLLTRRKQNYSSVESSWFVDVSCRKHTILCYGRKGLNILGVLAVSLFVRYS